MSDVTQLKRRPKMKAVLASGIALGLLVLMTAATTTQQFDSVAILDGSRNAFKLEVSGSTTPDWTPGLNEWDAGDGNGYVLSLAHGEDVINAGRPFTARIAVRNASPKASAGLVMSLVNPAKKASNKVSEDFFNELKFTVRESGNPLMEGVPASELATVALNGPVEPGGVRLLDLEISIDQPVSVNPANARAEVQVKFAGESL